INCPWSGPARKPSFPILASWNKPTSTSAFEPSVKYILRREWLPGEICMKPLDFLWCLFLVCALAGCGSEREEPFDPGNGNGDDDEDPDRARITVSRILHDDQTLLEVDGDRQNLILRDEDSYFLYFDRYSDTLPADEPDFNTGQVVLLDLGAREDSNCDYRLELQSVYAEEYN